VYKIMDFNMNIKGSMLTFLASPTSSLHVRKHIGFDI
jgi:hypothetical protein